MKILCFFIRPLMGFVVVLGLFFFNFSVENAVAEKIPFLAEDSIVEIQAKIEANGYSFTVAPNWVTRLPLVEREKLLSRHSSAFPTFRTGSSYDPGPLVVRSAEDLPSAFDWRDHQGHSYIGPIRNQGSCGSCYAFGACAAAEGVYNVAMNCYDENCLDLSEAFLAFCLDDNYPGYSGCDGSSYDYEELDALVERGVCLETAYPYAAVDQGCVTGSETTPRAIFEHWYRIPCGDILAIKSALMAYGVLDAAVYVTSAFQAYDSGIFVDYNTECDSDPCYYTATNHCIALVGWQDTSSDGDGYWILRNSWGTEWGEDGYMKIAYRSAHVVCEACYMVYESVPGQISGSKWNDYDGDGVRDAGEPGLANWKIYIDENLNSQWDEGETFALTDEDGNYSFTGLTLFGTYVIAEVQQDGWSQTYPLTAAAASSAVSGPSTRFDELSEEERETIEFMVIDSPPIPPVGYDRAVVRQFPRSAVSLGNVPTSTWTYGCSATSAGMLFGYYDRTGYSNMYNGPTNGGVAPLVNLGQGATPSSPVSGSCSIIATMAGFDGRLVPGHVDDYWTGYGDSGPDPWESSGIEHTWGECTADYMGTNQWKWDLDNNGTVERNSDGSTTYFYYSSGAKLSDPIPSASQGLPQTALCHGMRLFTESRGYTVSENYNQVVDTQATVEGQGFSFADFKAEIDNGRPVIIHVTGHTMIGVGYDETTAPETIFFHDTWDNVVHSMPWGGSYSGMTLVAVTVLHLAPSGESLPGAHEVVLGEGDVVTGINFGNRGPADYGTVRIVGVLPYYNIIQNAYDDADSGETIQVQIGDFLESPIFDRFVDVFLVGGFDAGFSVQTGVTNILGTMTIEAGCITPERVVIQ